MSTLEQALTETEIVRIEDKSIVIRKDGTEIDLCTKHDAQTLFDAIELFCTGSINSIKLFDKITIEVGEADGNIFKYEDQEIYLDLDEVVELENVCEAIFGNDDEIFGNND